MTTFQPDFILRVEHPLLNEERPGNSTELNLDDPNNQSKWRVTLSRAYDFLKVSVRWRADGNSKVIGCYIHVLPLNGSRPMMFDFSTQKAGFRGYASFCYVYTKAVQHDQNHGFYLIQSIAKELPPSFYIPTIDKPPSLPAYERNETTATMEAQISVHADFPQDKWFYIKSKASGLVLDVEHGFGRDPSKDGAIAGLNYQKLCGSFICDALLELQLWSFENGFIINRCTGSVLDVYDFTIRPGGRVIHLSRKSEDNDNQKWTVSDGFIHPMSHPNLVLGVDRGGTCDDTSTLLSERKDNTNFDQLWSFEAITFPWLASKTSNTLTCQTESSHMTPTREQQTANYMACSSDFVLDVKPRYQRTIDSLMKDIKTMDIALTFGINRGARNVALWAHRSVLMQEPGLTKLLNKLKAIEDPSTGSAAAAGVQSHHVTEFSLESYCSLIRFLYTGKTEVQIDLNDFAIGSPPNKPFSIACKERPVAEELFSSVSSTNSDPIPGTEPVATLPLVRSTTLGELFQLADCYQIQDLREHCQARIIESMNESNSVSILFEYAYRFQDLKCAVMKCVLDNLDKMYAGDNDPFEAYKDHPERFTLVTEIMKRKFKTSA